MTPMSRPAGYPESASGSVRLVNKSEPSRERFANRLPRIISGWFYFF
jgi:hypothetical protein